MVMTKEDLETEGYVFTKYVLTFGTCWSVWKPGVNMNFIATLEKAVEKCGEHFDKHGKK